MEPAAAIAVIETDLRRLVGSVLRTTAGSHRRDQFMDEDLRTKLIRRLEEERKRRFPSAVPEDLLAYTHLYELRRLIEPRWESFAPVFGEKREFVVMMDRVEDFRNAPAHSRELLPHERSLLDGIAGDIRTKVTRYLSQQGTDSMHYPIIESLRDSFGNEPADLGDGNEAFVTTGLTLQVGQTVEFHGRAWDPQGRELTWYLGGVVIRRRRALTTGTDVTMSWTASEADVGRHTSVRIELCSPGPYHRHTGYDHRVSFGYSVEPPS